MSDHDVQIRVIHNLSVQNYNNYFYFGQKIDKCSITDFNPKLSYESWDDIFMDNDVNTIFNNFLNTYFRIFQSSFPHKKSLIVPSPRHGSHWELRLHALIKGSFS